jgi:5-methylcytosine-specific restriction endonuclease McrA
VEAAALHRDLLLLQKKFKPEELTMDHIVPVVRGGKSTRGNVVPCCKECNSDKKYLTPAEMIMKELGL